MGPASVPCPQFHRKGGLHFRSGIVIYVTVGLHCAKCVVFVGIAFHFIMGLGFKCVPSLGALGGFLFCNCKNIGKLDGICGGAGHKELGTFFARIHGCVAF